MADRPSPPSKPERGSPERLVPPGPGGLTRRHFLQAAGAAGAGLAVGSPAKAKAVLEAGPAMAPGKVQAVSQEFSVTFQEGALVSLKAVKDDMETEWVEPGRRLGDVVLRFRTPGGAWEDANTAERSGAHRDPKCQWAGARSRLPDPGSWLQRARGERTRASRQIELQGGR